MRVKENLDMCEAPGCPEDAVTKKLCRKHYARSRYWIRKEMKAPGCGAYRGGILAERMRFMAYGGWMDPALSNGIETVIDQYERKARRNNLRRVA